LPAYAYDNQTVYLTMRHEGRKAESSVKIRMCALGK
jgi:hypothetical protein